MLAMKIIYLPARDIVAGKSRGQGPGATFLESPGNFSRMWVVAGN